MLKKRTGKGPELITTQIENGIITVFIKGLMTKMEENFVDQVGHDAHKVIEEVRLKMIDSFIDFYNEEIGKIMETPVKVLDIQWDAKNNTCTTKVKIL